RSFARPAFLHRVREFPFVRCDLLFFPFTLIVVPLVASADLHARVPLSLEFLEIVIGRGQILLGLLILCCLHGKRLSPAGEDRRNGPSPTRCPLTTAKKEQMLYRQALHMQSTAAVSTTI